MAKPIWFPFYPNDFLSSNTVALMSTEEIGAYLLLLCAAWNDPACSLPTDDDSLRKLGRFTGDLSRIKTCFILKRGRLLNKRLYTEWEKVNHRSRLGYQSAMKRWDAEAMPTHMASQCSSQKNRRTEEQSQKNLRTEEPSPSELKTSREVAALPRVAKGSMTWERYRTVYRGRYGADPVRNQTINSQIARLVDRLGAEDAPEVAAFYLSHNDPFYVRKRHPVGLLLQDAESLRTQWATGIKATTGEAKNAEVQDNVVGQAERIIANMQRKGTL